MSSLPARVAPQQESPRLKLYTPLEERVCEAEGALPDAEPGLETLSDRLKRIPAGMGALLIVLGVADIAIPFTPMIGPALLGLGCVSLCAHTNSLGSLDRWLVRRAPRQNSHSALHERDAAPGRRVWPTVPRRHGGAVCRVTGQDREWLKCDSNFFGDAEPR